MKKNNKSLGSSLSAAGLRRALLPPHEDTQEVLHGVILKDPFRPLENLDAPETAAWLQRESEKFARYIAHSKKSEKATSAFLTDAMNYDLYDVPDRYNAKYFRTYHEALAAQGRIEISDSANGPWKTLLDPNTLSADGTVALSGLSISKDGKRVVYLTSEAGSDAQTMHILDVETGKDLPDIIQGCRFASVLWDKDSHDSFQYTYPANDGTRNFIVKRHVIGQPVEQDSKVFAVTPEDSFLSPMRLRTAKYEWMGHSIGTDKNSGLLFRPFGSNEAFKEIVKPKEFSLDPIAEMEDGNVLAVTNKDAPRGKLVSFNPNDPACEKWQTILPEQDTDILNSAMLHKGKLFAFYTHDTADAVRVFTPDGKHLHDMPLPIQSVASYGRVNEEDDKFSLLISGFKSKGDFYSYDIEKNELTFDKKGPGKYNLNDCTVQRIYATSKDGTKVPMTVICGSDTKLDGTAAVKLYGYGGFNVPLGPGYSSTMLHWVKSGGIYVQANLRGGGEFGEDWYNQGRLKNKQNVFDDFAACAEHLIQNKYTSPNRLIINGGSNGELLTSATMLQRPDLFGAVVTEVPVTDMFRFHLSTYGAYWKSDYGDPDIKADFDVSARYSPLHNVKPGAKYPPHLIMTADHDDRVVPSHAFKLAATLQALSAAKNVTLLRVETKAGHGAGKPTAKIIQEEAEVFAFIEKAIGPVNQKAYRAKMARRQKMVGSYRKTHKMG